jgi:predicted DsbA family dithiol-disulfide isomerase
LDLAELFAGRGVDVGAMMARLRSVADRVGLPLGERRRTYNSRRAQELGKWAEAQGRGEAFRAAVYRGYFVEGRNIALPEELAGMAKSAGLDSDEARRVAATGAFSAAVDADWARARSMGVNAVPTHVIDRRASSGFLPYDALREFVVE